MKSAVNSIAIFEAIPGNNVLLKVNSPTFTIEALTAGYASLTGKPKEAIVGKGIFDAIPTDMNDLADTRENDLRESFKQVMMQKKVHYLPTQRYDTINDQGVLVERYWRAGNAPVFDNDGNVTYIIHTVNEITEQILAVQREEKKR